MPYLFWLAVLTGPFLVWVHLSRGGFGPELLGRLLLGGSYIGRPFSAFWFVGALFAVAIAYRALESLPKWAAWGVAVAALAAAYLVPDVVRAIPLGIGTGLASLIFLLAGRALRTTPVRRPVVVGVSLLAVSAALVLSGLSAPMDLKQADAGTPFLSVAVAIAVSAALVLLGVALGSRLGGAASRVITLLASSALMVILTHAAVLWLLRMPETGDWFYFVAATIVSWTAATVAVHTRAARLLTGSDRVPRREPLTRREPLAE